jgi:hypothetical protein
MVTGFHLEELQGASSEFGFEDMLSSGFRRALSLQGANGDLPFRVRMLQVEENPVATDVGVQVWEIFLRIEIQPGEGAQDAILVQGRGRYTLTGQNLAGTASRQEAYAHLIDRIAMEGIRRLMAMEPR